VALEAVKAIEALDASEANELLDIPVTFFSWDTFIL
jgi:hypothetical protein